jgi:hypothetical protein
VLYVILIILKYMSFYFCKFLWFDGLWFNREERDPLWTWLLFLFFYFSMVRINKSLGKRMTMDIDPTVIAEFLGCSNNYWTSSANETEPYHLYSYKVQCTSSSIHSFFVSNAMLRDQKATHYTYHQSGRTNVHARSWRHPHICNPNLLPILRERLRCT